jgi:DNA segregation ATPase FtsK/SpoIIIE-like protein
MIYKEWSLMVDYVKYEKALALLKQQGKISASTIQRGLGIGYLDSVKILEELKERENLQNGVTSFTWIYPKQ